MRKHYIKTYRKATYHETCKITILPAHMSAVLAYLYIFSFCKIILACFLYFFLFFILKRK